MPRNNCSHTTNWLRYCTTLTSELITYTHFQTINMAMQKEGHHRNRCPQHSPSLVPKMPNWFTLCKETFSDCLLVLMVQQALEKAFLKLPYAMRQCDPRSRDPAEVWCSKRHNKIEAMAYGEEDRAILLWVPVFALTFGMMLACLMPPSFCCYSVQSGQGPWLTNLASLTIK